MKITLTILFSLIIFHKIVAQDYTHSLEILELENQQCLDRGESMLDCSIKFHTKSDSLLNLVYKNLRNELNDDEKKELKIEQLNWLKIRDVKFDEINKLETGLGKGLNDIMYKNQRKAEFINFRTIQLDSLLKKRIAFGFDKSQILKFVPKGFTILDSIRGDLNRDKYQDCILILRSKELEENIDFEKEEEEIRPLIILTSDSNGNLKKMFSNNKTVLCHECGGMLGDPYQGVTIKNGFFSIEHYGGSSWRWSKIITYKFSEIDNNWYLHKIGDLSFHASDPEKIEEKIKTQKDFGNIRFDNFNIYK